MLHGAEALVGAIVESIGDPVFVKDNDHRFTFVNRAFCDLFGLGEGALLGKTLAEHIPPDEMQHFLAVDRRVLDTGIPDRQEETLTVNGLTRTIITTKTRLIGKLGERLLVGSIRDITAFKQVEEERRQGLALDKRSRRALLGLLEDQELATAALRSSEQRFRAVAESANDAIVTIDSNGTVVSWNRSATRIFGYTEGEVIGHPVTAIMPPRYRSLYVEEMARAIPGTERQVIGNTVERAGLRRDGHEFPIELSLAAWATADGRFLTSIIRDITERKTAEAEVRLKGAALEAAANPIVITDRSGTIVWANVAFLTGTGYELHEVIGKNSRTLIKSGAQDAEFYRQMWATILAGKVWQGELTNRRKDGSQYPETMTITPVRDADGEITHFVAVKRDLTQEKQQNAQFLQAQKMESVGRLAAGVAHDFNNLLTVILSYATFIEEDLPPADPRRDDVAQILSAAGSASDLTGRLLAFSRKQVVDPKVLQVNTIALGTEMMLRRLIGEGTALKMELAPDLWPIRADAGQVEQVIMNLVVNARDAMRDFGTIGVETANIARDAMPIGLMDGPASGDFICLRISDTGSGMDRETQEHVFEPFFTTKEWGKGTGLGLSTVHGIVRASGGHIVLESELGAGTTFSVYFPALDPTTTLDLFHRAEPTQLDGTETVLVVEDAAAIRSAVGEVLRRHGYTVLEASGGPEAFAAAAEYHHPIHLLLTDVVMPTMNGRQLADQLSGLRPELRVLYMSGYTHDVLGEQGVLGAGIALLHKPFTPGPLATKVREVLDAK